MLVFLMRKIHTFGALAMFQSWYPYRFRWFYLLLEGKYLTTDITAQLCAHFSLSLKKCKPLLISTR